jgi:hypothetical protein
MDQVKNPNHLLGSSKKESPKFRVFFERTPLNISPLPGATRSLGRGGGGIQVKRAECKTDPLPRVLNELNERTKMN